MNGDEAGHNHHIESHIARLGRSPSRDEECRCTRDAGLLRRGNGFSRSVCLRTRLHFYKGNDAAALCDDIDLADPESAPARQTARQDAPPAQAQGPDTQCLGPSAMLFCAHPRVRRSVHSG
jgi:hypothetical protein